MNITLNQKRFLIIWVLFHSFGLFVNLADIRGEIDTSKYNTIYLFTSSDKSSNFWPFTSYSDKELGMVDATTKEGFVTKEEPDHYYYGGLFNSYSFSAYAFYIFIGLAFIYVPKLWKKNN